jgi:hypothetical protein
VLTVICGESKIHHTENESGKRMKKRTIGLFLAGAGLASLFASRTPALADAPRAMQSTAKQRDEVAITVYNSGFGLVREVRTIDLGSGRVALEFRDVASAIQPETVAIKTLTPGAQLRVLEQNYRYDLLSPNKLLEKYVGKSVKVYRYSEKTGKEEMFDAEVLAVSEGPVLKIGNEITFNFPGRFAFPEVPPNLISKPTLVWLLDSGSQQQKLEVTYLSQGMTWHSDYVFVINADDSAGDITGWVTLNNNSGTAYEGARLKLVAGDVQRVQQEVSRRGAYYPAPSAPAGGTPFREESLFEYHLYTLKEPTTLLQNEQKQVTLLEAQGVRIQKRFIFYGAQYYYRGRYGQPISNQKVGVYLDIENRENNHLGIPLPKGIVRVYKADKSGSRQFIGEDNIDHTPRDEKIRIKMGEAFDIVGERKQTDYKERGGCEYETSWEISLRNHKDNAEEVIVSEPIWGDWEIVRSSVPSEKKDAHTFTFTVNVPKRGEQKITYTVRVRYC